MDFIREEMVRTFRQICGATWWVSSASGCSGAGPMAFSRAGATEGAEREGWEWIEGRLVCPAHARSYPGFGFDTDEDPHYLRFCDAWWPVDEGEKCLGVSSRMFTPKAAMAAAEQAGWQWIEGKLVCPAHARAYRRLVESGKRPVKTGRTG